MEDVERAEIDILDVLGYVYNLVEGDGVKVLLVANEDEIIKYHYSEPDKNGRTYKIFDEDTKTYLKEKEKTISDTIFYCGDINSAISKIISRFDDTLLAKFSTDDPISDIVTIMDLKKNHNLRSFIYACQKVTDIYDRLGSVDDETAKTIFFSILSFSMDIKSGHFPDWAGTESISTELGLRGFPLYRFCYDYIRWQEFDSSMVQTAIEDHKKLRLYSRNSQTMNDIDLRTVFDYYEHSEKEVITALENVEHRLDNSDDIPIYCYGELAYSLIACHTVLGFDYTSCKCKMISHMQTHGNAVDPEILFLNHFEFESENEKQQFIDFSQALQDAVKVSTRAAFDFSYKAEDIHSLYVKIMKNEVQATNGHLFISKFDLQRLTNMLFSCNPSQLSEWREILFSVYRHSHKGDFLEADSEFMRELMQRINFTLSNEKPVSDKIVLLQINYLIKNLQGFIDQLS